MGMLRFPLSHNMPKCSRGSSYHSGNSYIITLESLLEVWIVGEMGRQDLDGDDAVEAGVFSFVGLSHAAGTDLPENLIRAEFCAGR